MLGEGPIFTNHVDKARIIKREVMLKELQNKSSTSPNQIESLLRGVQMKKMGYPEVPSSYHSNASRTNKFEDPCKELWRKH
jgi:hypothetical protein